MRKTLPNSVEIEIEFDSYLWILQTLKLFSLFIGKRLFYQVNYKYIRGKRLELKLVDLLNQNKVVSSGVCFSTQFDLINDSEKLDKELESFTKKWRKNMLLVLNSLPQKKTKLFSASGFNLLSISSFLYSVKNQKEVFEPIVAEWHFEFFEDLKKGRVLKAKWTNIRWTYHFLVAMLQKSPIGDFIEFIRKLMK